MSNDILIYKLDDKLVHKLALETRNERMDKKDQEERALLPSKKYRQDFVRRVLTGGPLTFLEAKFMVREQLSFDKWKIEFYEVANFPQVRLFETEFQARKYWKRIKTAKTIFAREATLKSPAEHIYGERPVEEEYQAKDYKPSLESATF